MNFILRSTLVTVLLGTLALSHAYTYQTNNTVVASQRFRDAMRTVYSLLNSSSRSVRFYYSFDKESCSSWNVSVTVLRTFGLGSSSSSCQSTGSYTTAGTLDSGRSLTVYAQPWREYITYYAERIRTDDYGNHVVVDTTYATEKQTYEHYWSSIR